MRVVKREVRRKRVTASRPAVAFRSHEEMILRRLTQAPPRRVERGLQIQDLLYNSAPELRSLAFKSGFNLGAEAYRDSNGGIVSLEHLLENAGFGRIAYYPFESKSAFASQSVNSLGIKLGSNVHVFEAGVISGYLSAHARRQITARETECVFNGSRQCRFVASPGARVEEESRASLEYIPNLISAIQDAMLRSGKPRGSNHYYLYEIMPLLNEPVFSEASKFLYLSGKLLARSRLPELERSLPMAANFLRIGAAKLRKEKNGKRTISLVYGREIASGRFVDLTTALISGLVKGMFGRNVLVSRSVGGRGIYNVRMEMIAGRLGERKA